MKESQCRQVTYTRSGRLCERCCRGGSTSLHHRKKRGQGGKWDPENCVILCGTGTTGCHGWCEANPNAAEGEGFHVRPWQNPAEIPVKYRGQFALLTPDGEVEYVKS